ncbi:biotin--protein ligase-like [Pecten maximus]|uniref:biotin--protein ligase-like n=1 Tax=Pecten maximus TaxID=6579 RepID=UPI0014587633|nr:biotin--protein ligase-like [Pecten maximus]
MKSVAFLLLCPWLVFGHALTKNHVYIYNDFGSDELHVTRMLGHLRDLLDPSYVVEPITAVAVKEGNWINNAALFVMPGGFDLGFISALGNEGAENIRSYVRNGGSYLGQGAGSYYACNSIQFDLNGDDEVVGDRPLKFYPGMCSGPVFGPYSYNDYSSARAAMINFRYISPTTGEEEASVDFRAYYNGGNTFNLPMNTSNTRCGSIASFVESNDDPAIVKCNTYLGRAVLTSVHLEFGHMHLNSGDPYLAVVKQSMIEGGDDARIPVYVSILRHLNMDIATAVLSAL